MTDEQLMTLVQESRGESAMAALIERWRSRLVRILNPFGNAEDLLREVWAHVRQHPETYPRAQTFNVWIVRVAVEIGLHHVRRQKALGVAS